MAREKHTANGFFKSSLLETLILCGHHCCSFCNYLSLMGSCSLLPCFDENEKFSHVSAFNSLGSS